MPRKTDKRERLIKAARTLIHKKGFNLTTLADIAEEAEVPLGNVYYYFKTKEAIGEAVVANRAIDLNERITNLESNPDGMARLMAFVDFEIEDLDTTVQYGCPIGSLCQELAKEGGNLAETASGLMNTIIEWVEKQFVSLGFTANQARLHATHLIATMQGVKLLTNTYKNKALTTQMYDSLKSWLKTVAATAKEEAFA